jgi:hypothetical protein
MERVCARKKASGQEQARARNSRRRHSARIFIFPLATVQKKRETDMMFLSRVFHTENE